MLLYYLGFSASVVSTDPLANPLLVEKRKGEREKKREKRKRKSTKETTMDHGYNE